MTTYLIIQNYRCFVAPATIETSRGFTAFVGDNNAGKSAIMRFLLELRPLLQQLADKNALVNSFFALHQAGSLLHVLDPTEVFSNLNSDPIKFSLRFSQGLNEIEIQAVLNRNLTWSSAISLNGSRLQFERVNVGFDRDEFIYPGGRLLLEPFFTTMRSLSSTIYIGPFRNTINIGTRTDYLDIQIGEAFIKEFRSLKTGPNKRSNAEISS